MTVLPQLEQELLAAHRRTTRRGRRTGWIAPAVAVAATVVVAAIFVIALRHGRSASDVAGPGRGDTVALQSTPLNPRAPRGAGIETALKILQRRYAAALPSIHVSRLGDQLVLHGVTASNRAQALALAQPGRLALFDWEANVLLPSGTTVAAGLTSHDQLAVKFSQGASGAPGTQGDLGLSLYQAVRLAQRLSTKPAHGAPRAGAQIYLFGAPHSAICGATPPTPGTPRSASEPCYVAGPAPTLDALSRGLPPGTTAAGEIVTVPSGIVVLQAADTGAGRQLGLSDAAARFFVLRDNEAVRGREITDPAAGTDQAGQPDVTFRFTRAGAAAFHRVTRTIAHRGATVSSLGESLNQHFAIALDGRLLSLPQIDFKTYPDGIVTSSADVTGSFTAASARDLAVILRFGPLPVSLTPR